MPQSNEHPTVVFVVPLLFKTVICELDWKKTHLKRKRFRLKNASDNFKATLYNQFEKNAIDKIQKRFWKRFWKLKRFWTETHLVVEKHLTKTQLTIFSFVWDAFDKFRKRFSSVKNAFVKCQFRFRWDKNAFDNFQLRFFKSVFENAFVKIKRFREKTIVRKNDTGSTPTP